MRSVHTALPLLLIVACAANAGDASTATQGGTPAVTAAPDAGARSPEANKPSTPAIPEADLRFARNLSHAFRQVARTLQPSVVSIRTVERAAPANVGMRGRPMLRMGPNGPELVPPGAGSSQRQGLGTGFILREDGVIVTNNHVVRGAGEIRVRLADGRDFEATIAGADPETDVAVLRIDAKELAAAKLVESKDVDVGDWVLALGSPFGLDQTVTAGIISAKGRDHVGLATFENYLQTDAAINPGNSGGPLCTLDGAVVGMNTAISSGSGGSDGVGFAIPMEMVKRVADSLLADGRMRYGYMGVLLQQQTDESRETGGAVIAEVVANSPAARAGLQPGDIVTRIDGEPVAGRAALIRAIGTRTPGSVVKVEGTRDGDPFVFDVKLTTRPRAGVPVRDERGQLLSPGP